MSDPITIRSSLFRDYGTGVSVATDLQAAITSAETSAAAAATAVATAVSSAATASAAATTASSAAATAVSQLATAVTAAEATINTDVTTATTSISGSTSAAATSASGAATSATNSATSATAAATSATAAATSATAAASSATAAASSQTAAATSSTSASTSASAASTSATAAAASAASISSRTNLIINGSFRVNQRTYVSNTAFASGVYAHDRWKGGGSGCTYTFTAVAAGPVITITAGSLMQVVEAGNVAGGSVTLSWTGTAQGRLAGGSYAASPVVISTTANTAFTVEFNAGTLSKVKIEAGSTATPYDLRQLGEELRLCQRYYQALTTTLLWGYNLATGLTYWDVAFRATMRAAPTVAFANTVYANASGLTLDGAFVDHAQVHVTATLTSATGVTVDFLLTSEL